MCVGIAVAIPNGLVVPVIQGCERKTIAEIAAARAALVDRARSGRLQQSDLDGGTFTISNLGMFGIERFIAVLNPPQAAILAVGATEEKPELVARVNWSGAGVGMRTQSPSPARLRHAVRRVLDEPRFGCRALALQSEMASYDGPSTAADLVEALVPATAAALS